MCIGTTEENFISFWDSLAFVRSFVHLFRVSLTFSFFLFECFVLSFVSVCLCLALDFQKSYGLTYEFLEYAFQKHPRHLQSFFFGCRFGCSIVYILCWRNMCTICDQIEILCLCFLFLKKSHISIVWTSNEKKMQF